YVLNGESLGVRSDCDYRLRVSAKNEIAEGAASEVVHFKTRSGLFAAPEDVRITIHTNGDVYVHFDAVYDRRNRDNLTAVTLLVFHAYTILLTIPPVDENSVWTAIERTQVSSNGTVELLIPKTAIQDASRYALQIAAKNGSHLGDKSALIEFDVYSSNGSSSRYDDKSKPIEDMSL
ncbi:hypothetical protein Tcan_10054, partial [Toxocara canis]